MSREKLQTRVLALSLLVQLLLLVNNTLTLADRVGLYQSSMVNGWSQDEELEIHVSLDTGRPQGLGGRLVKLLRRWGLAWAVGGQEVSEAAVALTVTVTGSNVADTASLTYYVEGVPQGAGQAHQFLVGSDTPVSVGTPLTLEDNQAVGDHLAAMGLGSTQSWTVDYYVYARVEATGLISGETLVAEVPRTLFDTKTYELVESGTWYKNRVHWANGFAGYVNLDGQVVTKASTSTNAYLVYGAVSGGHDYAAWASFENNDAQDYGYTDKLPNVAPGSLIIHEARLELTPSMDGPPQRIGIYLKDGVGWGSGAVDNYAEWETQWGNRLPVNVTWKPASWSSGVAVNSSDLAPLFQALVDKYSLLGTDRMTLYLYPDGDPKSDKMWAYAWMSNNPVAHAHLYIRYSTYTASWYPSTMSLAEIPLTLDLVVLVALIVATALVLRRGGRREDVWGVAAGTGALALVMLSYGGGGGPASWYPIPPLSVTLSHLFGLEETPPVVHRGGVGPLSHGGGGGFEEETKMRLKMRSKPWRGAQLLGLLMIVIGTLGYTGVWWVGAYWDHQLVETYEGYNIHYFPEINVYAVELEGKAPQDWLFYSDLEAARRGVDSLLTEPLYVGEYKGYQVYQHQVYGYYWAEDGDGVRVAQTHTLEELYQYLDGLAGEPGAPEPEPVTVGDVVDSRREVTSMMVGLGGLMLLVVGSIDVEGEKR